MIRKPKDTKAAPKEETGIQRTDLESPLAWFEEMDRWFEGFRRGFEDRFWGPRGLSPWTAWERGSASRTRAPLVDLVDAGPEFVVRAELPGVAREDLDIGVTAEGIELRAQTSIETEETKANFYVRERRYEAFRRAIAFPEEVVADRAQASLKDGVLEVRVPKKEPTPKREPVKVRVD